MTSISKWFRLVIPGLVLFAACDSTTAPMSGEPVLTNASAYSLGFDGDTYRARIGYTFTNVTDAPAFVPNCNGAFDMSLERRTAAGWEEVWHPDLPECLSAPLVIDPGDELEDVIDLRIGAPGSGTFPQFDAADPDGTYRIVLIDVLSSYDGGTFPFGPRLPLEARVSNQFELRAH
jgi:hypothetical protein